MSDEQARRIAAATVWAAVYVNETSAQRASYVPGRPYPEKLANDAVRMFEAGQRARESERGDL